MDYRGTLPDDSVNFSDENPLSTVLKLMLSLALLAAAGYFIVGAVINYAVDHVTPAQERKFSETFAADFKTSSASPYLQNLTRKMAQCARLPYPVTVAVMDDDDINAFAAPGGRIYLTRGLLKKVKNENELAFIIGHELGHFKHKDQLRALGYKAILWAVAAMLGSDYGFAASTTISISSSKFSQAAELKADAYGLEVMNCAYGSVTDATKLFERMDDGNEWKYFIATHPGFEERVDTMKEIITKKGYDTTKKPVPLGFDANMTTL